MAWIQPIFDRTNEDVLKALDYDNIGYKYLTQEQKDEWNNGLKGALNYTDINRIENNIKYLANLYEIADIYSKTDWTYTDIITRGYFRKILDDIDKLRTFFKVFDDTPQTPNCPINTYQQVNDIEKILYDMYWIYENNSLAFARDDPIYKAELYANDDIGVI